jgi:hypothetical protein
LKLKLIVLSFFAFSIEIASAQTILAGQTTGEFIHYSDTMGIFLHSDTSYFFDFDQDSLDDLKIICFYYTTHVGYENGIVVEPLNNSQICNYTDEPGWVIKYAANEAIGSGCTWSSMSSILREHSSSIVSGESYLGRWGFGAGYLGFRICNPTDTIVGWIGMNTMGEDYLTLYDYAFFSVSLSAGNLQKPITEVKYNSLVRNKLVIDISNAPSSDLQYQCLNGPGQVISQGKLVGDHFELDCTYFPAGMYFFKISGKGSTMPIKVLKFIKE